MPPHEQGFDLFPVLAHYHFTIAPSMCDSESGVEVGMCAVATDRAAKRLLVRSVGAIWIMTHAALLRRIGAAHSGCLYATFGGVPGKQVGLICLGEVLIRANNYLVPHMPNEALSASACGGR